MRGRDRHLWREALSHFRFSFGLSSHGFWPERHENRGDRWTHAPNADERFGEFHDRRVQKSLNAGRFCRGAETSETNETGADDASSVLNSL